MFQQDQFSKVKQFNSDSTNLTVVMAMHYDHTLEFLLIILLIVLYVFISKSAKRDDMVDPSINRVFFETRKERQKKKVTGYFYCYSDTIPIWFESRQFDSLFGWHTQGLLEVLEVQSFSKTMIVQSPFNREKSFYYCYGYDRVLNQSFIAEAQLRLYSKQQRKLCE